MDAAMEQPGSFCGGKDTSLLRAHWHARPEQAVIAAQRRLFNKHFVRLWRLYFGGSAAAFGTVLLQLFQVVFSRAGVKETSWPRHHLYEHPFIYLSSASQ